MDFVLDAKSAVSRIALLEKLKEIAIDIVKQKGTDYGI